MYGLCKPEQLFFMSWCETDEDCASDALFCQDKMCQLKHCDATTCDEGEICWFGNECIKQLIIGDWCHSYDDFCSGELTCDFCSESCVYNECKFNWECPNLGDLCEYGKCMDPSGHLGSDCVDDLDCNMSWQGCHPEE